jgi:hypothetical protein
MMRARYLLAGLLALGLAACSTGASTAPSVEPTAEPSPQPSASTAPSPAPTPTTSVLDVKVTFDGETCTYLGPSVIVDGTVMHFEYAPDQGFATSSLLVYGVKPGTTYGDLLESLANDDGDVSTDIPDWVYEPTAAWVQGAGTMLYTIESVKQGQDAVDYAVGGYQVMCNTPAGYPAVQLSVAGP